MRLFSGIAAGASRSSSPLALTPKLIQPNIKMTSSNLKAPGRFGQVELIVQAQMFATVQ
jgi:hypothetical protein